MHDIHLAFTLFYPPRGGDLSYFKQLARIRSMNLFGQLGNADATIVTTIPTTVSSKVYFDILPQRPYVYYVIKSNRHAGSGLLQFLVEIERQPTRWIYYDEDGHVILYRKDGLNYWLNNVLSTDQAATVSLHSTVAPLYDSMQDRNNRIYNKFFDFTQLNNCLKGSEFGTLVRSDVQDKCYRPMTPQRSLDGTFYLLQQKKIVLSDCHSRISIHHDLKPGPSCIPLWLPNTEKNKAVKIQDVFDQDYEDLLLEYRRKILEEAYRFFSTAEVEKYFCDGINIRQVDFELPTAFQELK